MLLLVVVLILMLGVRLYLDVVLLEGHDVVGVVLLFLLKVLLSLLLLQHGMKIGLDLNRNGVMLRLVFMLAVVLFR